MLAVAILGTVFVTPERHLPREDARDVPRASGEQISTLLLQSLGVSIHTLHLAETGSIAGRVRSSPKTQL